MQSSPNPHPSIINRLPTNPRFPLGKLVATHGAIDMLKELQLSPFDFISRHWQGDWGDLCPADIEANNQALQNGTRLMSAYGVDGGRKLWIITEADRSATTLLLPEEY